jgi:glutaredoxin-like YruB-family protein
MTELKVYTTPTCEFCAALKEYLRKNNIQFTEKDITTDKEARDEMVKKYKVRSVPLIVYGDETMTGFDPVELEKMLHK